MAKLSLHVVVTFHQPLAAGAERIETACDRCYLPLIDAIEHRPSVRACLHFNGHLLDHLSRQRPELLLRLKGMVHAGRLEILGGLFYGGMPGQLPELDVRGQIQMMGEFWESFIGEPPQGFWLPDLAWPPELPRMLDDTGLSFGFVSSSQLAGADARPSPLGVVERGGQSTAVLVVSAGLSSALPTTAPDEWLDGLMDGAAGQSMSSVWVRAESLASNPEWFGSWLDAVVEAEPTMATALPSATLAAGPVATPLRLRTGVATELASLAARHGPVDGGDFVAQHAELDTLYRRMLRTSDKLRLSIAAMEEDGLEDEWSDTLATAQRLVFAAQSSDCYGLGAHAGFGDARVRDAVLSRLCQAEAMIDTLVHGEDDWIATEEEDRDGDLVEEVFAANRHLSAWLVPARAGTMRTLDDRATCRNLLDASARRAEPSIDGLAQASLANTPAGDAAAQRRGGLISDLPATADSVEWTGVREWLIDADATPDEFFSGTVDRRGQRAPDTEILENAIDEEGDCSFTLRVRGQLRLDGVRPRVATIDKTITIPIDAPEVAIAYDVELDGNSGALVAMEVPLRVGPGEHSMTINGEPVELRQTEHPEVSRIRVEAGGTPVHLTLEPAVDLWVLPVRTTVQDLDGDRAVDGGVIVVPVLRVSGKASARLALRIGDPLAEHDANAVESNGDATELDLGTAREPSEPVE